MLNRFIVKYSPRRKKYLFVRLNEGESLSAGYTRLTDMDYDCHRIEYAESEAAVLATLAKKYADLHIQCYSTTMDTKSILGTIPAVVTVVEPRYFTNSNPVAETPYDPIALMEAACKEVEALYAA